MCELLSTRSMRCGVFARPTDRTFCPWTKLGWIHQSATVKFNLPATYLYEEIKPAEMVVFSFTFPRTSITRLFKNLKMINPIFLFSRHHIPTNGVAPLSMAFLLNLLWLQRKFGRVPSKARACPMRNRVGHPIRVSEPRTKERSRESP